MFSVAVEPRAAPTKETRIEIGSLRSGQPHANLITQESCGPFGDLVQAGGVSTQNFALYLDRQLDAIFSFDILGQLEGQELLNEPFGMPERVVTTEENPVLVQSKE